MAWSNLMWGIVGLIAGALISFKAMRKDCTEHTKESERLVSYHRSSYLKILQRELANMLIREDPKRFLNLYKKINAESSGIKTAEDAVLKAKQLLLTEKYPQYSDFDLICVRDYVLYADALSPHSLDEIEQRYSDILIFQALQSRLNDGWPSFSTTSDKELEHLEKYAQQIMDTKLKGRLKKAISDFYKLRKSDEGAFETNDFSVRPVDHFAEVQYGVHLKAENEFGLYGFFVFDDGKTHENYYRSNKGFQKEERLDDLGIEEMI